MSKRVDPRTLSPALQAIWAMQHGIDPPTPRTRVNDRSERMQVALNQKSKALEAIKAAPASEPDEDDEFDRLYKEAVEADKAKVVSENTPPIPADARM